MEGRTQFKAYVTKSALTGGIEAIDAYDCFYINPNMIGDCNNSCRTFHGEGREWHRTAESALARAEEMRVEKIKSLEKQIERLKNLTFTVPE